MTLLWKRATLAGHPSDVCWRKPQQLTSHHRHRRARLFVIMEICEQGPRAANNDDCAATEPRKYFAVPNDADATQREPRVAALARRPKRSRLGQPHFDFL
jgi:hypothetical protein